MMYTVSREEQRLVQDFSEAAATKKALGWSAAGAAVLGLVLMPMGLLLWALAAVLAVLAARTSFRMDRIRGQVAELRTIQTPSVIQPGAVVSLIPDPYGLSGDPLVGRVGSTSEDGGDAEIISQPLGGKQWVSKHSGSFSVQRGDWVSFHRDEDGKLTIWRAGTIYADAIGSAARSGDQERSERLAQLERLGHAKSQAARALEELIEVQGDIESNRSSSTPPRPPEAVPPSEAGPELWTEADIISHFGVDEGYFAVKYQSYVIALKMSGKSSHWNDEVDSIAREKGALTEREIEVAQSDFHQAVLNRVKLALVMERGLPA